MRTSFKSRVLNVIGNKIHAQRLIDNIHENPFWIRDVIDAKNQHIDVIGFANFDHTPIAWLSPLLRFCARDEDGECASFRHCKDLKTATGMFMGMVDFTSSGIEAIDPEGLQIKRPNNKNLAAKFFQCESLETATGTFPGGVIFSKSGVKIIKDLKTTGERDELIFFGCNIQRCPQEILENKYVGLDPETRTRLNNAANARKILKNATRARSIEI